MYANHYGIQNPLNKRSSIFLRIHQINTILVYSYWVKRDQDADVVHVRLGWVSITVTVHRQTVHHIDIEDISVQIIRRGFSRFGHALQESVLIAAPHAAAGSSAVDVCPTLRRSNANRDVTVGVLVEVLPD